MNAFWLSSTSTSYNITCYSCSNYNQMIYGIYIFEWDNKHNDFHLLHLKTFAANVSALYFSEYF